MEMSHYEMLIMRSAIRDYIKQAEHRMIADDFWETPEGDVVRQHHKVACEVKAKLDRHLLPERFRK